ncbi:hypothetical protein AXW83_22670 [Bosea sp. PAMC 26642]|nr:hypothetical protein AXW83_22670 [Bosea sp. PAMC 26642]
MPGTAFSYHYGAHLWLLAAHQALDIPLDVLVARYGPHTLLTTCALSMFAFGQRYLRLPIWAAILALLTFFGTVGVPPTFGNAFAIFAPFSAALLLSPALAFIVFFATLAAGIELSRAKATPFGLDIAILAALSFVATGARSVAPPILIFAFGALLLRNAVCREPWDWRGAAHILGLTIGFAAGMYVFYGIGGDISGTGFVRIVWPLSDLVDKDQFLFTVPVSLLAAGVPTAIAAVAAFVLMVVFQAGALTPGFFFWLIRRRCTSTRDAQFLLAAAGVAGIFAFSVTVAPGSSHVTFLQYTNICFCLLGALGFAQFAQILHTPSPRRVAVAIGLSVPALLLFIVQIREMPKGGLTWFYTAPRAAWSVIAGGKQVPPIKCSRPADSALLADPSVKSENAVVAFVLPPSYCQEFWWIVENSTRAINFYSLSFPPGKPVGVLQSIIRERYTRLLSAVNSSEKGVFPADDLTAIAKTLLPNKELFAIAKRGLVNGAGAPVPMIVANERFAIYRFQGQ